MGGPLSGVRVLDWSIWQMGPVAGTLLGDLGADVIKIEQRAVGDPGRALKRSRGASNELPGGRNLYFENNNRNKRGIAIDLTRDKGKEIVYRLVAKSDIFLQNFRGGVAARLGMDYETLRSHNPLLIYASGSGYGSRGPERNDPAFDLIGMARSGMMTAVAEPSLPPVMITGALADQLGGLMLAHGIMVALFVRERQGVAQQIDISQLGSMIWLQGLTVAHYGIGRLDPPHRGRAAMANPLFNHYQCQDGKWIALAHLQSDRYWPPFCRAIGQEALAGDPRFANALAREQNSRDLIAILDGVFIAKPRREWMDVLRAAGDFIFTPVNRVPDLFEDEQVLANDYIVNYDHPSLGVLQMLGFPVQYSKTPASLRMPAPELGQHTEELLLDLAGYSWQEIEALRDEAII